MGCRKKGVLTVIDYKSKLDINDSILTYNDSIFSNYQLFEFEVFKLTDYKIKVYSLCDCLGFQKYIFNPEIKVFSQSGNIIETKLDSVSFGYVKGPISVNKIWRIKSENEDKVKVVLYSNNQYLKRPLYRHVVSTVTYANGMIIPVAVPVSFKSSLVGNFYIEIEECL